MPTATTRLERQSGPALTALGGAAIATALILGFGLYAAQRHAKASLEAQREERSEARRASAELRGSLFVTRIAAPLPMTDPDSLEWDNAPAIDVVLQAQREAMPMLQTASVPAVRLQAMTDGRHVAWRVSWPDDTLDANVDMARFTDAVALQFPVTRDARYSMGQKGQLVQILHWKALWQKDIDEHFQDVQDLHPNYWTDLYWFAKAGRPYRVPDSFGDPRSHQWFAAYSAGNPMADFNRAVPVEELIAEGYGSLAPQVESLAVGRGSWHDGEWAVVFARPLRSDDEQDYQIWPDSRGTMSVAVWDGAGGNVGGRKHWSNWIEFEVSP